MIALFSGHLAEGGCHPLRGKALNLDEQAMRFSQACLPFKLEICLDFAFIALHKSIRAQENDSVHSGCAGFQGEQSSFNSGEVPCS
jgi:hypothetical protein